MHVFVRCQFHMKGRYWGPDGGRKKTDRPMRSLCHPLIKDEWIKANGILQNYSSAATAGTSKTAGLENVESPRAQAGNLVSAPLSNVVIYF